MGAGKWRVVKGRLLLGLAGLCKSQFVCFSMKVAIELRRFSNE